MVPPGSQKSLTFMYTRSTLLFLVQKEGFFAGHRRLIVREVTGRCDFVVREIANCITIASNSSGGEHERLLGVPYVVEAVSIGTITILPGLAPRDGR
jgi:hypothetical protein